MIGRMKYEYTCVESSEPKHFTSMLTIKATEGWRLVKVVHDSGKGQAAWVGIMEREAKN